MKRILVDSDIIISAMAKGETQTPDCLVVMRALAAKEFIGVTTPVIMANVQHVLGRKWEVKKRVPDRKRVVAAMEIVLPMFPIMIDIGPTDFWASMASTFVDLEDGLQHYAALRSGKVDRILTCNVGDFKGVSNVPFISASEFARKGL